MNRLYHGASHDDKYKYAFSVEEVNKLVLQGVPFREAYKKVGQEIEKGTFAHSKKVKHSHEESTKKAPGTFSGLRTRWSLRREEADATKAAASEGLE